MPSKVQILLSLKSELQSGLARAAALIRGFASSAGRSLMGVAGAFTRMLRPTAMKAIVTGAIGGTGAYLLKLASNQEQAEAKLGATLKATGNAAGFSLDQLKKMAMGLQQVTTYGDETTLSAMAILSTFKNIKGNEFERAIKSAQDMSVVFEQDLKSSITQVSKALDDPIAGLAALRRVGVSFTQQQKDQIKALTQAGKMVEAQGLIFEALEGQVGGASIAVAKTFGGTVAQLRNRLLDIGEDLGYALEPGFRRMIAWFNELATFVEQNMPAIQKAIAAGMAGVGDVAAWIGRKVQEAWKAITQPKGTLQGIYQTIDVMLGSWEGLQAGMMQIADRAWGGVQAVWEKIVHFVRAKGIEVIGSVRDLWAKMGEGAMEYAMPPLAQFFIELKNRINDLLRFALGTLSDALARIVPAEIKGESLIPGLHGMLEKLRDFETRVSAAVPLPFILSDEEVTAGIQGDLERALKARAAARERVEKATNEALEEERKRHADRMAAIGERVKGALPPGLRKLSETIGQWWAGLPAFKRPQAPAGVAALVEPGEEEPVAERAKAAVESAQQMYLRIATAAAGRTPEERTAKAVETIEGNTKQGNVILKQIDSKLKQGAALSMATTIA